MQRVLRPRGTCDPPLQTAASDRATFARLSGSMANVLETSGHGCLWEAFLQNRMEPKNIGDRNPF